VSLAISLLLASVLVLLPLLFKASRCVFLLMIPQFFSKNGRATVLTYAMLLTLAGPVENIRHNSKIMYESILCSQVGSHLNSNRF
jgi:hypothetical protein